MRDLRLAVMKARPRAPGPDGIHNLLKHLTEDILKILKKILDKIWTSANFPDQRRALIPIPKPNKDHTNPLNYWPITLTSCLCKVLERMIMTRFTWYLGKSRILGRSQCDCHGHMPICPIWACPWAKNLSNLPQIGSRLCGTHISETAGWIYRIESFMDLSKPVVVQHHSYLPICPIWACPWAKNLSNEAALGSDFAEPISLKPLDGFIPFRVLWNCLDL